MRHSATRRAARTSASGVLDTFTIEPLLSKREGFARRFARGRRPNLLPVTIDHTDEVSLPVLPRKTAENRREDAMPPPPHPRGRFSPRVIRRPVGYPRALYQKQRAYTVSSGAARSGTLAAPTAFPSTPLAARGCPSCPSAGVIGVLGATSKGDGAEKREPRRDPPEERRDSPRGRLRRGREAPAAFPRPSATPSLAPSRVRSDSRAPRPELGPAG